MMLVMSFCKKKKISKKKKKHKFEKEKKLLFFGKNVIFQKTIENQ